MSIVLCMAIDFLVDHFNAPIRPTGHKFPSSFSLFFRIPANNDWHTIVADSLIHLNPSKQALFLRIAAEASILSFAMSFGHVGGLTQIAFHGSLFGNISDVHRLSTGRLGRARQV